ncbi:MAG: hypothetical protein OXB86_00525 [Bdellovibrionales bacterium]|nr:hypothetical protein [Bdellovibrionales bacterium]
MIRKTILMAGFMFPMAVEGVTKEPTTSTDPTAKKLTALLTKSTSFPSLCDCALDFPYENCDRNCEWLCEKEADLTDGKRHPRKCVKNSRGVKEPIFADTVDFLSLKSALREIEKKAAKKSSLTMKPEHSKCTVVDRLDVNVKPSEFKEGSCPEKYIRTHTFQHKISSSLKCSHPDYMDDVYQTASQYVKALLRKPSKSALSKPLKDMTPKEKLWHECPESCSFYITYDVTTVRKSCDNILDVKIQCGHLTKRFLGHYKIQANQVTDMMCRNFKKDKLVLKKAEKTAQ